MKIASVNHKALKALMAQANPSNVKGLDAQQVKKIHRQIAAIKAADNIDKLDVPGWKLHELTPKYPGKWSLWVTGNYRLTFRFDKTTRQISDLDYEDYH